LTTETVTIANLPTLVVESGESGALTVAFLHGFAMRPEDLAPFGASLRLPATFLFPRAPLPVPQGGFAWWDVDEETRAHRRRSGPRDLSQRRPDGRAEARARLRAWLEDLPSTLRQRPLVLAGFSQGGMLLMDTVLMEELRPAAVALLSSSCIALDEWVPRAHHIAGLPAFVSHGEADDDIALGAGVRLAEFLAASGAEVQFHRSSGGHEVPLPVWRALRQFLLSLGARASYKNSK
jgi:phospholipase/carboxylesterase